MFLEDEPRTTRHPSRYAGSAWMSYFALSSCVFMLVMLSGTANAGTMATDAAFTQIIGTADQRILLGLLLLALSAMAAASLGLWRRSLKDFLDAESKHHGL